MNQQIDINLFSSQFPDDLIRVIISYMHLSDFETFDFSSFKNPHVMCDKRYMSVMLYKYPIDHVKQILAQKWFKPAAYDNNGSIRRAAENGRDDVVKLLLDFDDVYDSVDPTTFNNHALNEASLRGHHKVVKLLLDDGRADPTSMDSYCIQKASDYGHTEVVKLLLDDGRADPNEIVYMNSSCQWDRTDVIKLLLDDGRADPNDIE